MNIIRGLIDRCREGNVEGHRDESAGPRFARSPAAAREADVRRLEFVVERDGGRISQASKVRSIWETLCCTMLYVAKWIGL